MRLVKSVESFDQMVGLNYLVPRFPFFVDEAQLVN